MAETKTPPERKTPAKVRVTNKATKAVSVASFAVPEAKAATVAVKAKTATAAKTASTGEKAAQKAVTSKKPSAPETKSNPTADRVVSTVKKSAERRVRSVGEGHRKTAAGVESKYRKEKILGLAEMHPKTRMLAAEYMGALVMSIILLFLDDKTYHEKMSRFFIQMTGISGIFFVLALASSSPKTAKYAIPFGLLIDLSMLGFLFKQGAGKTISEVVGKQDPALSQGGGGGGVARPTSAVIGNKYAVPHYGDPSQVAPGQTINDPENNSGLGGGVVI